MTVYERRAVENSTLLQVCEEDGILQHEELILFEQSFPTLPIQDTHLTLDLLHEKINLGSHTHMRACSITRSRALSILANREKCFLAVFERGKSPIQLQSAFISTRPWAAQSPSNGGGLVLRYDVLLIPLARFLLARQHCRLLFSPSLFLPVCESEWK